MTKKKIDFCEVIDLTGIRKHCPDTIHECEFCDGLVIDHDNISENFIVDYDDIRIKSELNHCEICNSIICNDCSTKIEDTWEVFYICPACAKKYADEIEKIQQLQGRLQKVNTKLENAIYNLRHINLCKSCKIKKPRRIRGKSMESKVQSKTDKAS